jgi:hypothetical protein
VGQHHLLRATLFGQLRHGVDAGIERRQDVEPEAVHPQVGTGIGQRAQIVEVGGIAGVADNDLAQIDALLGENFLCHQP